MMSSKPNIVFIMADDMGYGDLSCYGATKISTPNMDAVAANGMMFTDAHSSSAVCTPSRYSVITGRYCWRTALKSSVLGGFGAPLIEPGRETVASMLKKQGYSTYAVGKWHIGLKWKKADGSSLLNKDELGVHGQFDLHEHIDGFNVDYGRRIDGGPVDLGFDRWFGISGSLDMPPYCFIEDDHTVGIPDREKEPYGDNQRKGMMVEGWRDDQCDLTFAEKACEYINDHVEKRPDKPFFMYMTPAAPHRPCVPPEFIRGASQAGDRGDAVVLVDWMVGEVTRTLRENDLEENTLLIITSDNGALATCANGLDYGHKSNGEWRGQKADIWEGGHREPFIAQWPAVIKPGGSCSQIICLMDLMTTCAELTQAEVPNDAAEDSVSFASALTGEDRAVPPRESLVHHSVDGTFSIRMGNWKMIAGLGSGGFTAPKREDPLPGGPIGQLYDLSADPKEENNLWQDQPERVTSFMKELKVIQKTDAPNFNH